jgi:phosphopantetheinyl transferase
MQSSMVQDEVHFLLVDRTVQYAIVNPHEDKDLAQLLPSELKEMASIMHEKRRKEYAAIRKLKNRIFKNHRILYTLNGKPYLETSEKHIGISHSKNFALFAYSDSSFGCDIEEIDDRLLRVKNRFTNHRELSMLAHFSPLDQLCMLWTSKEAIYKLLGFSGVNWNVDCQLIEVIFPRLIFKLIWREKEIQLMCYLQQPCENAWISWAIIKENE